MDGDKDLERLKKIAAAKARSAALAKKLEKEKQDQESSDRVDHELAQLKAEEAAKARAAAQAKKEAKQQEQGSAPEPKKDLAQQKAEAAAKARAAAQAKKEAKAQQEQGSADEPEKDLAKQKAAAAAKAKAAAQAKSADSARTKEAPADEEEVRSVNQSYLDLYIKVIEEHLGNSVLEDYYINTLSKDVPTLVVKKEAYYKVAEFLKYNEQLAFDYLSELHGSDFETHMEVYTHLYSYKKHQSVAFKVKIDREAPMIESLAPFWAGANWPECEAYDLLGIKFKGHPNLHRIMLGEDWIGHPLRKDYEPYDVEV